jgi:hypothetical protein
MPGEVDPRLIGLLQGVMGFTDSLRDAGTAGSITVRLGREDGLRLLELVAGANDAEAEAWSQRDRPPQMGVNSLKIASLIFEWPHAASHQSPDGNRVFTPRPGLSRAANENSLPSAARFYGFDEDTPALR